MKVRRFIIGLLLLLSTTSYGKVTVLCKAYYNSKFGWGDGTVVEVSFYTGDELNEATDSYKYHGDVYATVWFSQSQVAIIKINAYSPSTREMDVSDFKELFRFNYQNYLQGEQVNSESERQWRIEAKENERLMMSPRWIDPRLN